MLGHAALKRTEVEPTLHKVCMMFKKYVYIYVYMYNICVCVFVDLASLSHQRLQRSPLSIARRTYRTLFLRMFKDVLQLPLAQPLESAALVASIAPSTGYSKTLAAQNDTFTSTLTVTVAQWAPQ